MVRTRKSTPETSERVDKLKKTYSTLQIKNQRIMIVGARAGVLLMQILCSPLISRPLNILFALNYQDWQLAKYTLKMAYDVNAT